MRFVLYGYAPTAQALKDDILMERAFLDTSVDRECCKEGELLGVKRSSKKAGV